AAASAAGDGPELTDADLEIMRIMAEEEEIAAPARGEAPPAPAGGGAGSPAPTNDLPTLMYSLAQLGIETRLDMGASGAVRGISFMLGGVAFRGGELGADYAWDGLLGRGLTYEPARDLETLRENFGAGPTARTVIKEVIDGLLAPPGISGADLARGLSQRGVTLIPVLSGKGALTGVSYETGGIRFPGQELGHLYGLNGLLDRGAVFDRKTDVPAVKEMADRAAASPAPRVTADAKVRGGVPLMRALAESILRALPEGRGARIGFPEFLGILERDGVRVVPNIQYSTGRINGLSFKLGEDGAPVKGSSIRREFGWKGIQESGVDYDPARDREALAERGIAWQTPEEAAAEAEAAGPPSAPAGPTGVAGLPGAGQPAAADPAPLPRDPMAYTRLKGLLAERILGALGPAGPGPGAGPLPLPEFLERLERSGVQAVLNYQNGQMLGISFAAGGWLPVKGSEIGAGFGWGALRRAGVEFDAGRDREAAERRAWRRPAGAPPVPPVQAPANVQAVPPVRGGPTPAAAPGGPGGQGASAPAPMPHDRTAGILRDLILRALGPRDERYPARLKEPLGVREFIERLERDGVAVVPNLQPSGRLCGLSFGLGGAAPVKGSSLGTDLGWNALQETGVVYDKERDREAVAKRLPSGQPDGGARQGGGEAPGAHRERVPAPLAGGGGAQGTAPGAVSGAMFGEVPGGVPGEVPGGRAGEGRRKDDRGPVQAAGRAPVGPDGGDVAPGVGGGAGVPPGYAPEGWAEQVGLGPEPVGRIRPGLEVPGPGRVPGGGVPGRALDRGGAGRLAGPSPKGAAGPRPWPSGRFRFPGFGSRTRDRQTSYFRGDAAAASFSDLGAEILVFGDGADEQLAALMLGQQMWGAVEVSGGHGFLMRAMGLAEHGGITVRLGPEVAGAMEAHGFDMRAMRSGGGSGPGPERPAGDRAFFVAGLAGGAESDRDAVRGMAGGGCSVAVCGPPGVVRRCLRAARECGIRIRAFVLRSLDVAKAAAIGFVFGPAVRRFLAKHVMPLDAAPAASPETPAPEAPETPRPTPEAPDAREAPHPGP
ncbi:MAG: hypothetical protein LBQ12_08215, partial [Deltaproteobacteria bacterium]|nr:hypothetical protein [Deltaproteobacteria bacterium]